MDVSHVENACEAIKALLFTTTHIMNSQATGIKTMGVNSDDVENVEVVGIEHERRL